MAKKKRHQPSDPRDDAAAPAGPRAPSRSGGGGSYTIICVGLGAVLGWVPWLVHGPIPAKFDVHDIDGSLAVWAFYAARLLIGVWVGISRWPSAWFLRGPLCGALSLLPVTFFSLAVPECGPG